MDELTLLRDTWQRIEPADIATVDRAREQLRSHMRAEQDKVAPRHGGVAGGREGRRFALAAAAAVIAMVVGVLWSVGSAPGAYAEWEPTPGPVDPHLVEVADERCQELYGRVLDSRPDDVDPMPQDMPPLFALDQRGEAAVAYFAGDEAFLVCHLTHTGATWQEVGGAAGGFDAHGPVDQPPFDPDRDHVRIDSHHTWRNQGTTITTVTGRVADDVAKVRLQREDGTPVVATVREGTFVAWWPSAHRAVRAEGFDHSGRPLGGDAPKIITGVSDD